LKVGLIDIGGKIPNLALMKISAYHKIMGDTVTLGSGGDLTYISCIFSKYSHIAEELLKIYPAAVVGGPGWDHKVTLPPEIEIYPPDYSLYSIDYGLGRLTAGCPGDCPWCVVPACEGSESRTVAWLDSLINPRSDFLVLLDANILACPDWPNHFENIRNRGLTVHFTQGLDIRFINDMVAAELAKLKISNLHRTDNQVFFAWDRPDNEHQVIAGINALVKAGFKSYNLRFYILVGYDTTWEQDWHRFNVLQELGCKPFIMCYQGSGPKLKSFARWVNRFYYKSCSFEDFKDGYKGQEDFQQALGF
jgi:hypothetical protein